MALSGTMLVLGLSLGAAAAVSDATYRPLRHVATAIHEAGHALVALAVGRQLAAVRLHRDSSGETVSVGHSRGIGVALTLLAGYPAPSMVGLLGVWATAHEQSRLWILGVGVVLVLVLLMLRNFFGVLVLGASLMVLFALTRAEAAAYAAPAVLAFSSFLSIAGVRGAWELWHSGARGDDAQALARVTGINARSWRVLFLAIAAGALGLSAWMSFDFIWQLSRFGGYA